MSTTRVRNAPRGFVLPLLVGAILSQAAQGCAVQTAGCPRGSPGVAEQTAVSARSLPANMDLIRTGFAGAPAIGALCAVTQDGKVQCRPGDDVGGGSFTPVEGLQAVRALAAGRHAYCALTRDEAVSCWGCVGEQRGATQSLCFSDVQKLALSERIVALAMAPQAIFMLSAAQHLYWLGAYQGNWSATPVLVDTPDKFTELQAADYATCAISEGGGVECLSRDAHFVDVVAASEEPSQLVSGESHFCALSRRDQSVLCWGSNDHGQLGSLMDPTPEWHKPVAVPGLTGVTRLWSTDDVTCALKISGELVCWGQPREAGIDEIWEGGAYVSDPRSLACAGQARPQCMDVPQLRRLLFSESVTDVVMNSGQACVALRSGRIVCSPGLGPRYPTNVTQIWPFIEAR